MTMQDVDLKMVARILTSIILVHLAAGISYYLYGVNKFTWIVVIIWVCVGIILLYTLLLKYLVYLARETTTGIIIKSNALLSSGIYTMRYTKSGNITISTDNAELFIKMEDICLIQKLGKEYELDKLAKGQPPAVT